MAKKIGAAVKKPVEKKKAPKKATEAKKKGKK